MNSKPSSPNLVGEEIARFVTESNGYYALTHSGARINIAKSRSYQPSIEDEQDFKTYLWVEAKA